MSSPKLLLLNDADGETSILMDLLAEYALLVRIRDHSELLSALKSEDFDALLCGWTNRMGNWQDALQTIHEISPEVPVIVFSRTGGEREWVQAIESGAFDLLSAPYNKRTVLPVLEQAFQSREARRIHHHTAPLMAEAV